MTKWVYNRSALANVYKEALSVVNQPNIHLQTFWIIWLDRAARNSTFNLNVFLQNLETNILKNFENQIIKLANDGQHVIDN